MQITKGESNLGRIKFGSLLSESLSFRKVFEEFAALYEVHDKVDAKGFLKDVIHANNERMVDLVENQFLNLQRIYRVMLYHHILPDALHRVQLVILLATDQVDFAESASTNYGEQFEIVPGRLNQSLLTEDQTGSTVLTFFREKFLDG